MDVTDPHNVSIRRHDSLERALDWSVSTLTPEERGLFGLVCVPPSPFPLDLAEELASAAAGSSTDHIVAIARLVNANLLQLAPTSPASYSVLETRRTYGRQLLTDVDRTVARNGLLRWAMAFADTVAAHPPTDERRAAEVRRFFPLVRAAVRTARDTGDSGAERRIVVGVEPWVTWRQHVEIWQWVEELAAREPRDAPDAEILRMAAVVALRRGQIPPMRQLTERCVTADPAGPAGPSAQLALILLAYAERRWHDLRTLVTASQHQDPEQHAFEQILLVYAYLHFGDTPGSAGRSPPGLRSGRVTRRARLEGARIARPRSCPSGVGPGAYARARSA